MFVYFRSLDTAAAFSVEQDIRSQETNFKQICIYCLFEAELS